MKYLKVHQIIQDSLNALEIYFGSDLGTQITMCDGVITVCTRHHIDECEDRWMEIQRTFLVSYDDQDNKVITEVSNV